MMRLTALLMAEATPPTDLTLELLERHRQGDPAALGALLRDILPWLHQEVSRHLGNEPRADQDSMDLVQTTVMNFLSWGPRFIPQNGAQLRALLKRIASNEIIDQRRRRGRSGDGRHLESFPNATNPLSGFGVPGPSAHGPTQAAERVEDQEWVRLALQFLPEQDRYLLLASEVEGADWASIAQELSLASPDAARVRGARLKPKLANILRQLRAGKIPVEMAE